MNKNYHIITMPPEIFRDRMLDDALLTFYCYLFLSFFSREKIQSIINIATNGDDDNNGC